MNEFPDLVAQIDQAVRGAKDAGRLFYGYYEQMVRAGFTEDQALVLTLGYQRWMLTASRNDG